MNEKLQNTPDPETRIFEVYLQQGNTTAKIAVRSNITKAMLRHNPDLREAVTRDITALATEAQKQRGYADLSDLTREGYTNEVAIHFAEKLAEAGRKAEATRDYPESEAA